MPILIAKGSTEPLSQGDLLEGINLYTTHEDGEQAYLAKKFKYALVVSRPCAAVNKGQVVVAGVEERGVDLPGKLLEKIGTIADLQRRFTQIRDLDGSDGFYLGPGPSADGKRLLARLDFLMTVMVPMRREDRQVWIEQHRRVSLDPSFRRDLHTRLFLSVAKQGFDDMGWFADDDLDFIIQFGETKVGQLEQEVREANLAVEASKVDNSAPVRSRRIDGHFPSM